MRRPGRHRLVDARLRSGADLTTYSLPIPLWPVYLLLIIGFLLTALVAFLQCVEDVTALVRGTGLDAKIEAATDV